MRKGRIKHIIRRSTNGVSELCAEVGKDFDKESIHKFRVAVKSLRSFLRLQKMHTGNKKIKLTKKFKRLYDIAGTIREAQLELQFMEHKPALPHYTAQLHNKIILSKEDWKQCYSAKVIEKLDKKLTSYKYKKMPPEALAKFFESCTGYISQLGNSSAPTDSEIHDTRKKIKDILYTSKLASKQWKAASDTVTPINELDTLSDLIGNYNDERIIMSHIKEFPTKDMDPVEKSNLKQLKDREAKKLRKKKAALLQATRKYIKDAS